MPTAAGDSSPERVAFAVTTRSHLRGVRHFPLMFIASRRIRRQLGRTPGVVRWASVIAGPREFWTITIWSDRDRMMEFMGSGAHESIMWLFSRWLQSFWLTRWRPTVREYGSWEGLSMAPEPPAAGPMPRSPDQQAALDAALAAFPRLRESVGPDGAATYATAGFTRHRNRLVEGVDALMIRISADHLVDRPRLWRDARRIRRGLAADPDVLRRTVGFGGGGELFVLAVLRDRDAGVVGDCGPLIARLREDWQGSLWSMHWDAANEFGHWDGMRIRQSRHQHRLTLPPGGEAAAAG